MYKLMHKHTIVHQPMGTHEVQAHTKYTLIHRREVVAEGMVNTHAHTDICVHAVARTHSGGRGQVGTHETYMYALMHRHTVVVGGTVVRRTCWS